MALTMSFTFIENPEYQMSQLGTRFVIIAYNNGTEHPPPRQMG
ncbi:MAG: hypothetical protein M2R45_00717 [Verrucomicrobia subdivision 3 bacterium]|nr:hypothetical protein [Limisphaerales bacterium]MCS1414399.1 hypothetical protein [Limisphaerales bacterium]